MRTFSIFLLFSFIFASCSNPKTTPATGGAQNQSPLDTVTIPAANYIPTDFVPNPVYLGDSLTSGAISMSAPRDWETVLPGILMSMRLSAQEDSGKYRHYPEKVYHFEPSSRMMVSTFSSGRPSGEDFDTWAGGLAKIYKNARKNSDLDVSWRIINNLHALQLYAENKQMVFYKLVFDVNPPITIDYSVPQNYWNENRFKVESSIASVRALVAG